MPSSVDGEKAVLCAMLADPGEVMPRLPGLITAGDFYLPSHRLLFGLMTELHAEQKPVEVLAMQQVLLDRGKMEEVGGPSTLLELSDFIGVPSHWDYYAEVVVEKSRRRSGMEMMTELWKAFFDPAIEWRETALKAQGVLSGLMLGGAKNRSLTMKEVMHLTRDVLEERIKAEGKIVGGLCLGFTDLDRMFLGISSPHILTIAGRPSMGKSVLLMDICRNLASGTGHYDEWNQAAKRVLLISTEMGYEELGERALAAETGINIKRFADGFLKDNREHIEWTMGKLSDLPLHIAHVPGASSEAVVSLIHAFDAQYPDTAAYVVDHMSDLGCDGVKDKGLRYALVTAVWEQVTNAIKRVGKVGILGCQLSRNHEGTHPSLSDLRDSGKVEEVSNSVVMIHRPHYYERMKPEHKQDKKIDPRHALLLVAKNRRGRCGPVEVFFDGEVTRFSSKTVRLYSMKEEERQQKDSFAQR